VLRSYKKR